MRDYYVDIEEIVSFINSGINGDKKSEDYYDCLNALTQTTDERFLDDRALAIRKNLSYNKRLLLAIQKLATRCIGKVENRCGCCPVRKYCNAYILEQRQEAKTKAKIIDLFCGAGGLSLGFVQSGFTVVLANDIEECCVDTYAHNHPETPRSHIIQGDIRSVVSDLGELVDGMEIDVVVGGPPCQGFSMANRQRLIDDPRNYLYKNYIEVVKRTKPKFFVMENVKGMLSVSSQVKEDFEAIGYSVECHVFNAKDFGVPQHRERLIYIGNRIGVDNNEIIKRIIEMAENMPQFVLSDALYGLRPLCASRLRNSTEVDTEESGSKIDIAYTTNANAYMSVINNGRIIDIVCNHKARYNNDRDIEIYGRMHQGDKSDDPKIADIMPYASRNDIFKDKYFKLEEGKVCKTITAHMKFDCNMYIHPTQARGLTPREAARVQSYPDDYFFRGAYTKTYMQIGNSVPPLMSKTIASVITQFLGGI